MMAAYTIQSRWQNGEDAQIKALTVHLEYKDASTPFYSSEWVVFDAPDQTHTWTVSPPDADAGQAFYSGVILYVSGQTAGIPLTAISDTTVVVGQVEPRRTITILPDALSWQQLAQATVTLEGGVAQQSLIFSEAAAGPRAWSFIPPAGLEGYRWRGTYMLRSGALLALPPVAATDPVLRLPPLPSSYQVDVYVIPGYFADLSVTCIEVTLLSGLGVETTHSFTPGDMDVWQATVYERPSPQGGMARSFDYHYTVNFAGLSPPYTSPLIANIGEAAITIEEIGLIQFSAAHVNFDLIASIQVRYDVTGTSKSFALNARDPSHILKAGQDYDAFQPLAYDLDYTIGAQGHYVQAGLQTTHADVVLATPVATKTVQIVGSGLTGASPPIKSVQLSNLEYNETGKGWQLRGFLDSITLDRATVLATRSFPAVDQLRAALKYEGVIAKNSGEQTRLQPTYVTQTVVAVGDIPLWFSVRVDPSQVDWRTYREVDLSLYNQRDGKITNEAQLEFTPDMGISYWGYFLIDAGEAYYWRATYVPLRGQPVETAEQSADVPLLTLPRTP